MDPLPLPITSFHLPPPPLPITHPSLHLHLHVPRLLPLHTLFSDDFLFGLPAPAPSFSPPPPPPAAQKETPSAADTELATAAWRRYISTEHNFLQSLFAYQQRNDRVCSACRGKSRTIETLSPPVAVSLPSHDTLYHQVRLHRPGQTQLHMTVALKVKATTQDLIQALSVLLQSTVPASDLIALELSADGHRFELPVWRANESVQKKLEKRRCELVHVYEARRYTAAPNMIVAQGIHRLLRKETSLFASPYRPQLIGAPLMLCLPAAGTGAELYETVWAHVRHLVPNYILGSASRRGDKGGEAAGANPYPFVLTYVKLDGSGCADCEWMRGCIGCKVEHRAVPHHVAHRDTVGVDWNVDVYEDEYKTLLDTEVRQDPSVAQEARNERATKVCQLSDLLASYFSTNEATDGMLECEHCKKRAGHRTTSRIHALPAVLVVQLKRFHWTETGERKIFTHVGFPLQGLDMRSLLTEGVTSLEDSGLPATMSREETVYDLAAVVNHLGSQTTWGHYHAHVRLRGGDWCVMNDAECRVVDAQQVVTNNAYQLFYVRRDVQRSDIDTLWPLNTGSGAPTTGSFASDAPPLPAAARGTQGGKLKAGQARATKADPCCTLS